MVRRTQLIFCLLSVSFGVEMSTAFAPPNPAKIQPSATSLEASKRDANIVGNTIAASVLTAAVFFLGAPDAMALQEEVQSQQPLESSSQVVAARSGGRMGGRSSSGSRSYSGSRGAPSRSYSNTRTYSRTTVVRPASPSVIVAPTPTYSPFGFNPFFPSPFGFGFGGGIGDAFRDYRQDDEIARDRRELEEQRMKNMELEQRLAQLERGQALKQSAPAPLPPQTAADPGPELESQRAKNAELEQKVAQLEKGQPAASAQ